MGHILSKEGVSPVKSKLDAILPAPTPKDVSASLICRRVELLLQVYERVSSKVHPLYQLLSVKLLFYGPKRFPQVSKFWFIMSHRGLLY